MVGLCWVWLVVPGVVWCCSVGVRVVGLWWELLGVLMLDVLSLLGVAWL